MTDRIYLGSEVVMISIEDARKLVKPLTENPMMLERMQELEILDILMYLQGAVTRRDLEMLDHHRWEADDA